MASQSAQAQTALLSGALDSALSSVTSLATLLNTASSAAASGGAAAAGGRRALLQGAAQQGALQQGAAQQGAAPTAAEAARKDQRVVLLGILSNVSAVAQPSRQTLAQIAQGVRRPRQRFLTTSRCTPCAGGGGGGGRDVFPAPQPTAAHCIPQS